MQLKGAKAQWSMSAGATPVGTLVAGSNTIGEESTTRSFKDADIAYSFQVEATADGDIATLNTLTGVVTQTAGTPIISDGDGRDFEGINLLPNPNIYGIIAVPLVVGLSTVDISTDGGTAGGKLYDGGALMWVGASSYQGSIAIALNLAGNSCRLTIIGKSGG